MKLTWQQSLAALIVGGLTCLSGCSSTTPPTETVQGDTVHFSQQQKGVPQPGQQLFASPEEATAIFRDALAIKDRRTLIHIFGNDGKLLIFAGDKVQEDNDMQALSDHMNEYLQVEHSSDTTAILHVGKENWPFPVPLVKSTDGWFFDTVAGLDELLNRRIGDDELNAIAVCHAFVTAETEYAAGDRDGDGILQYSQHFMSHPGKHDGLYWEPAANEAMSPMGPLVAEARMEGYPATQPTSAKPHPFHGYIFHILTAQGEAAPGGKMDYNVNGKMTKGFAMIACPVDYGATGIMTFIVARDGKVFQKNLGEKTRETVKTITEYNPDKSWDQVKE